MRERLEIDRQGKGIHTVKENRTAVDYFIYPEQPSGRGGSGVALPFRNRGNPGSDKRDSDLQVEGRGESPHRLGKGKRDCAGAKFDPYISE